MYHFISLYLKAELLKKKHWQQIACAIAILILQYTSQAFVATKLSMLRFVFMWFCKSV